MTQLQLNRQLARITGEPLGTLRALGFGILRPDDEENEPEDIVLVLDCPFCRHPVPYPGHGGDGSELLAECDRCDVYFGFDICEVYATAAQKPSTTTCRRIC